ncbi:hypothetical protein SCOCK_1180004 [Actinacidiphila cocklensis]|uniref:Uncharacterized protein n=1 Tax=Actinacidiphila cocklensis TaxID=887465 RepID=A0A9W4GNI1_9ACTN|nr:hypothetical protein SCOCK_1180004 [Actinacidiphila cocklensis]
MKTTRNSAFSQALSFTKPISLSFDANASVRHHMQILTCILNPLTSNPVIAMRNDVDSY